MATFTLNPARPIPNKDVKIAVNGDESGTNFFRVWATIAPTGSSLDNDIKNETDPRNRLEVYSGNGGEDFPFIYNFDKGGKYTFIVQEYIKGSGYGGAYQDDPNGFDLEQKNGTEYTVVLYVGQRLTQSVGTQDNKATLTLWVWNSTIRPTYRAIHGEDTPSLTAESSSPVVTSAIESSTVKATLLTLHNQPVTSAVGVIKDIINNIWDNYNDHLGTADIHGGLSNNINNLDTSLRDVYTANSIIEFVNSAIQKFTAHFTNNNLFDTTATAVGPGYGTWHLANDRSNSPMFTSVSTLDEAFSAICDLHRCYENHRLSGVHYLHNDTTNTLIASTPLMNVHKAFLDIVASENPPVPPAQSPGAQLLISSAGFKEV